MSDADKGVQNIQDGIKNLSTEQLNEDKKPVEEKAEVPTPPPASNAATSKDDSDEPVVEVKLASGNVNDLTNPLYVGVSTFEDMHLHQDLLKGIYAAGFEKPSKIQEKAIPLLLHSPPTNLIGQSQSGTGKTAAFTLAMLSRINTDLNATQSIVLAPARELARQIQTVVASLSKFYPATIRLAVKESIPKGQKVNEHVVIGTPGTILDLIKRRQIQTSNVRFFVLDEADNMLDQQGLGDQSIRIRK